MAETIILDPGEVATGRTALDITPWIKADGIDWADAEIAQYAAEAQRGQIPVDYRLPNRQVSIPLVLQAKGGTAFETVRANFQAKAALFQREGGWIKRVTSAGSAVWADVQNATLKLSGSWSQAHKGYDVEASLGLELTPDFYGAEVTLADHVETTAAEIRFTETGIDGDYPGRVRIVVDNDEAQNQLGLIWSFRSRHYSSSGLATPVYEGESLTVLDAASSVALTGASGGNAIRHNSLATTWTPVLSTDTSAFGPLVHTGTYRIWARVYSTSVDAATGAVPVQMRFVWDVGDLTLPEENSPVTIPGPSNFYLKDFGEVRLDAPPVGTHRWKGVFQAKGDVGGENVYIDRVWILNADEGYGALRAPVNASQGLSTFLGRDDFNQTAGALTGKTAPLGGVWVGAGDADDYAVETTGKTAQRASVFDVAANGRWATLNLNLTTTLVQVSFKTSNEVAVCSGLVARYIDSANHLRAYVNRSTLSVVKRVTGTDTTIATATVPLYTAGPTYTMQMSVDTTGRVFVWYGAGPDPPLVVTGTDSVLATAGALATGDPGVYDEKTGADNVTRNYDSFVVWAPTLDAVLFASQSAELRHDGMFREDSTGTAYGPVSHVTGDLPRLPPSGLENRTTEVLIKASRGDLEGLPDAGIDNISARITYRPSWLTVPGT